MKQFRTFVLAATAVGVAACTEQTEQTLPFDPATTTTATGTVGTSGGTVTLASGAELSVPNGALSASSGITLTREANPTIPSTLGTVVGQFAVRLGITGGTLNRPARLEILTGDLSANPNAWLADFAVTDGAGITEIESDVGVDLSNGRAIGNVRRAGLYTVVVPNDTTEVGTLADASVAEDLSVVGSELFTGDVRSISQNCRPRAGTGNTIPSCAGVSAQATASLLNQVGRATLTRPSINGTLTLSPTVTAGVSTASGSITLRAMVRVRQGGTSRGGFAGRIPVSLTLSANSNSRVTQSGGTLSLTGFTVSGAEPAFGAQPTSFTLTATSATTAVLAYTGTVSTGDATGTIRVRFPFTIGY